MVVTKCQRRLAAKVAGLCLYVSEHTMRRASNLGVMLLVSLLAGYPTLAADPTHAQAQQRPKNSIKTDENADTFCRFEGGSGHQPFECHEKRPYPVGTPCLCPGSDRIGRITHP